MQKSNNFFQTFLFRESWRAGTISEHWGCLLHRRRLHRPDGSTTSTTATATHVSTTADRQLKGLHDFFFFSSPILGLF